MDGLSGKRVNKSNVVNFEDDEEEEEEDDEEEAYESDSTDEVDSGKIVIE